MGDEALRIGNEGEDAALGQFGDLLRLQAEFQARLAEETFRYLRRLQGMFEPHTPGTVVRPDEGTELRAEGAPGGVVQLRLDIENRQRAHCVARPALTPLVGPGGATWFAAAEPDPVSTLLAPGEECCITVRVPLPDDLPAGTYRGSLLLQGFRNGALPV
ncbi:MAG: hypothetical protein ACRD0D_07280, partial [Acidimicrobiales bacterium]